MKTITIARSVRLIQAALAVLMKNKELLVFPILTVVLMSSIALVFAAPVVLQHTGFSLASHEHWKSIWNSIMVETSPKHYGPTGWFSIYTMVLYYVAMVLTTGINVAFYHEIMSGFNGGDVSLERGLKFAISRWQAILLWALFAGLVGIIIRAIQEKFGIVGRIITGFIGIVWSAACAFIIPTLVCDTKTSNPITLLKGSAGTLRRAWGELVIGFVGIEVVFSFIALVGLLLGGAACLVLSFGVHSINSFWCMGMIAVSWVALLMVLVVVGSVVNPLYRCALYIYATEGVVPGPFNKELLDTAWKVKKH